MKTKIRFNRMFEDIVEKTIKSLRKRQRFEHKRRVAEKIRGFFWTQHLTLVFPERERVRNGKEKIIKK